MEMAICVTSGALVGAAMVASQEASRRRREAFMRKGDQVLHRLLSNPNQLSELKRVSRMPDEALVWFIIVHVGTASLATKLVGERLKVRLKHGGQGWSVARETAESDALPPAVQAIPALGTLETVEGGSSATGFEKDSSFADFDTTSLFVWSIGLQPLIRLRLQRRRRHGFWSTVGWAELPIGVEAGRPSLEEVEACLYDSKPASRQIRPGESMGTVNVLVETRGMYLGDLRRSGLTVGTIVAAPLPGQETMGVLQGVAVEGAGVAVAQGAIVHGTSARGTVQQRGRNRIRPRVSEDTISESSEGDEGGTPVSDSSSAESGSDSDGSSSSGDGSPIHSIRQLLGCHCR
mmetsp:Transcript_95588/g.274319  ORF Transcript_95588/g.274319 Transcript_95588/m.274319 type:complete len:348 (+) Transcript_95588:107-1150(+)